jgi:hypothetical protein
MVRTVSLTGPLSDTGEDRVSSVSLGDVVDELLDENGLSDSSSSEESNLSSTGVGSQEVDDLDSRLEDLGGSRLVDKLRGVGVDGAHGDTNDGTTLVDRLSNDVHDTSEAGGSDWDHDGVSGVDNLLSTDESLGSYERGRREKISENSLDERVGRDETETHRPWRWCGPCSLPSAWRPRGRGGAQSPGPRER